jgi:hypothetical protein
MGRPAPDRPGHRRHHHRPRGPVQPGGVALTRDKLSAGASASLAGGAGQHQRGVGGHAPVVPAQTGRPPPGKP